MLYILLIIIAVGVLLISEAGKKLLGGITLLVVIAGLLYLGFWAVIITIGLLSDKEIRDNTLGVLGLIMLALYPCYGVYLLYKKRKNGELTVRFLKKKIKNWFVKEWKERRVKFITVIVLLVIIIVSWVIILILLS